MSINIKCKDSTVFLALMKKAYSDGRITAWLYENESWLWITPPYASLSEGTPVIRDYFRLNEQDNKSLVFSYVSINGELKVYPERYRLACEQFKRSFCQLINTDEGEEMTHTEEPDDNIDVAVETLS